MTYEDPPMEGGNAQPGDGRLGKLLLEAGKLSEHDIENIRKKQEEEHIRFGEAALRLGLIRDSDLLQALSRQFAFPCVPEGTKRFDPELVAAFHPFSPRGEALRWLRSQLLLRWFVGYRKMLALIATEAGQGCSWTAANLAVLFSQLGEKVLLIDTDLRNPSLHRYFGLDGRQGLSGILSGRQTFAEVGSAIEELGDLAILTAGAPPPNPQELLARPAFLRLLEAVAETFDVILLDTAPALSGADAQIVAASAGGAVLVTRRHLTRTQDALRVKEQLLAAGAELVGAVLIS
jgi:chain length determinant protein tyrosine kinase EpsG